MFNLLNTDGSDGTNRARMCKILNSLFPFFHGAGRLFWQAFYLVENKVFRNALFGNVGYRIALLVRQPVLVRIRSRKD